MGLIGSILGILFGGGRNVITQTVEAFRPNAEAEAKRTAKYQSAALQQFGQEFRAQRGLFDRFIDGLNRLPRPFMALGTIGLFISAMVNPIWFSERMQGLVLVPNQLWWLLGAIVTFYFGARYQAKAISAKQMETLVARTPQVISNIKKLQALSPEVASLKTDASLILDTTDHNYNQVVEDWKAKK